MCQLTLLVILGVHGELSTHFRDGTNNLMAQTDCILAIAHRTVESETLRALFDVCWKPNYPKCKYLLFEEGIAVEKFLCQRSLHRRFSILWVFLFRPERIATKGLEWYITQKKLIFKWKIVNLLSGNENLWSRITHNAGFTSR